MDELPQFDPNVDFKSILPINQKRTNAFLNHFVMNTVSFLNDFAETCESRLLEFEYKLQKVEASLLILEAQLDSIPEVQVKVEEKPAVVVETLDLPEINNEDEVDNVQEVIKVEEAGPVACKDSRFVKYFKMVKVGVDPQGVRLKMKAEGFDPNILDTPNQIIPGFTAGLESEGDKSLTD